MAKARKFTQEMIEEIRDAYATREFTMSDLANNYGCSITAISNAIRNGYAVKPKGVTETAQRTEIINEHIMESFDDDIVALVETIDANIYGNRNVNQACYEVVQGGCLLIYYNHVNEFLKELGCQLSENDETNWSMYKKLVVKRMEKLYNDYKKNGGN